MDNTFSLIIGATGGIGKATTQFCLDNPLCDHVVAVSRDTSDLLDVFKDKPLTYLNAADDEPSIAAAVKQLKDKDIGKPKEIYICTGFLHNEELSPEKRIEHFDAKLWQQTSRVNTVLPMLWLKHLMPFLSKVDECKISVLSARVGSIEDNELGGWYSYRASKSALNMLLKTAAVEFSRRAKGVRLISFHPGTTDTSLSKPFQKNVPDSKLFDGEFVAQRLVDITRKTPVDHKLAFLDWDNKPIKW